MTSWRPVPGHRSVVVDVRRTGYTDAVGSEAFNLDLSQWRAAAVRDFLAPASPGVRFMVAGKGEADPVAPNEVLGKDNPDGRRLNRRVTVSIGR